MARTSRPHQLPRLLALGLAGAALATAGCAPITTQQTYAPSDGVLVARTSSSSRAVRVNPGRSSAP